MSEQPIPPSPLAAMPEVRRAQRWNVVWVVPLVALFLGVWLLYRNFAAQGPVVQVKFETADGISAGKTEVRCRSVRVGMVKHVRLSKDLKSVITDLELDPEAERLLRVGTRFWVVKPRLTPTEFSGVGTLITGAYIELDPGPEQAAKAMKFRGLETPPATNTGVPGLRLLLVADEAGSLAVGAPVYFRGFEVGRVEGRTLDPDGLKVTYNVFVREDYAPLVTSNTRFWNTSGIDITAGAEGFKLRTPSFQAMVSGGITFGPVEGEEAGQQASDGMTFTLYRDEDSAEKSSFKPSMKFLLLFDQTVRGLAERAPVQFRGITVGRVAKISFDLAPESRDARIPVLVEIDPALMPHHAVGSGATHDGEFFAEAVGDGLRASLKTGNLITGALYVDLDFYEDLPSEPLAQAGGHTTIPTISTGFAQLEVKLTALLDKLQALPLDKTMEEIAAAAGDSRDVLAELEATAAAARSVLEDPEFRELPGELRTTLGELRKSVASAGPDGVMQGDLLRTLEELRAALRSIKSLSSTIDEKPSSLLFGRDSSGNPVPKAPR